MSQVPDIFSVRLSHKWALYFAVLISYFYLQTLNGPTQGRKQWKRDASSIVSEVAHVLDNACTANYHVMILIFLCI